jgi:hypothetical protein
LTLTTTQVKGTKAPAIYTDGGALVGQDTSSAGAESDLTLPLVPVRGGLVSDLIWLHYLNELAGLGRLQVANISCEVSFDLLLLVLVHKVPP